MLEVAYSNGVLIHDGNFILLGKSGPPNPYWDIPKGVQEMGENSLGCLIRETKEEFNIDLSKLDLSRLVDLGLNKYRRGKDLHLFAYKANYLNLDGNVAYIDNRVFELDCYTYFESTEGEVKEVISYDLISILQVNKYICPSLQRLFNNLEVIDFLKTGERIYES